MRNNEQGRSMIEMLGVLAIVGVLSVGGIAGYSKAMNKFKTNKMGDQLQMISTNIRTLFSSQRTYTGLNNGMAIRAGLIPGEMYAQASKASAYSSKYKITNAFGGDVTIEPTLQASADDDMAFLVTFEGIPQNACVSIATTDWGGDSGSGLAAMWIGAAKSTGDPLLKKTTATIAPTANTHKPGHDAHGLPFSIVDANTACATDTNVAMWKYF